MNTMIILFGINRNRSLLIDEKERDRRNGIMTIYLSTAFEDDYRRHKSACACWHNHRAILDRYHSHETLFLSVTRPVIPRINPKPWCSMHLNQCCSRVTYLTQLCFLSRYR